MAKPVILLCINFYCTYVHFIMTVQQVMCSLLVDGTLYVLYILCVCVCVWVRACASMYYMICVFNSR